MATITEAQELARELTALAPPPDLPLGVNVPIIAGSGEWTVERVGSGVFAVRARYLTPSGAFVVVSLPSGEMRGTPSVVANSIRFAVQVAKSSRLHWVAIEG